MTTREKIIHRSIKAVTIKRDKVRSILDADPYSDAIKLHKEAADWVAEHPTDVKEISESFRQKVAVWAERQMHYKKLIKQQKSTPGLISKLVIWDKELADLRFELYLIELRR